MNPYDWQKHTPSVEIPRSDLERVVEKVGNGGSVVLLGGRGMGKSVFLRQVQASLTESASTQAILFKAPPTRLTVEECFAELAKALGVPVGQASHCDELFEAFFNRPDAPERVVLIYDEFDRYAPLDTATPDPPGRLFFNDLEIARRELRRLGVLAAGSIGVFLFRDVFGSSFLARATHLRLRPFERPSLDALTAPFEERGTPLDAPVLDAVQLSTGGNPALVTYSLQELWDRDAPSERDAAAIFATFRDEHREYLNDLLASFSDPRLFPAPQRILELVRQGPGAIERRSLKEACGDSTGPLRLDYVDALRLLEAAGLVRTDGSPADDDPVLVRPVSSFLNLPTASVPEDFPDRLASDLTALLGRLRLASADFFRPSRDGTGKSLVPESVFAAFLALGFELLGWRSEREGRTDLKLRRNGGPEEAVVEVKIWGRNDFKDAQRQVESYWNRNVVTGAVVQLSDGELPEWPQRYRETCLHDFDVKERSTEGSPVCARFRVAVNTPGAPVGPVEHFLLWLRSDRPPPEEWLPMGPWAESGSVAEGSIVRMHEAGLPGRKTVIKIATNIDPEHP